MKFSKRLEQLPEQFFAQLVAQVSAAVKEGRDVINLGQGNPDQPTPSHIIDALQRASEDPSTHKYSPFRGIQSLREAAADFYSREYGVELDPNTEISILFGSKAGLVELPMAMMDPGDVLLLPDPGYPDYLSALSLSGADMATMPLTKENGFLPVFEDIPEDVRQKAELMYLNYPNNPTGAMADAAFFEEAIAFAKQHDIAICHDFAYGALGFDGNRPVSFLQQEGAKEVGIEMYTLSKTYNMAGWRVGFAAGNAQMIAALDRLHDHMYCSLFPAVQQAAAEALIGPQHSIAEAVERYSQRRTRLVEECAHIGWEIDAPEGSFFAWLPVPAGFSSQQFADKLLAEVDVSVAPGNGFGSHGEGYVRVGLVVDEERIAEAIQRIGTLGLFTK